MRTSRPSIRWLATAVIAGVIVAGGGWAVSVHGATPTPTPISTPSATPAPTETPSAPIDCESAMLTTLGDETIARGHSVQVRFQGFTPDVSLTLLFVDWAAELPDQTIGTAMADDEGTGTVAGVVPADAPIREAILRLRSDDGCSADTFIVVLGSTDTVAIDDDVVVPGQQIMVTAGGFAPETFAGLTMDVPPTQGECPRPCPRIAASRTTATGAVVLRGRIPRDTSSGNHQLWVTGESIDGISELQLSVDITVVRGTVPPTDTEPGG